MNRNSDLEKNLKEENKKKTDDEIPRYQFKWYDWLKPVVPIYGYYYSINFKTNSVYAYRKKYYGEKENFPESVLKYVQKRIKYNIAISFITTIAFLGFSMTSLVNNSNRHNIQNTKQKIQIERTNFKKEYIGFDKNGSGFIDSNEIMERYDLNKDNKIDFNEFTNMSESFPKSKIKYWENYLKYIEH